MPISLLAVSIRLRRVPVADRYRAEYARRLAEYERGLLVQLPSSAAERIAWGKAARIAPLVAA